jgi:hypothetical protein
MVQHVVTVILFTLIILRHIGIIDWPWASIALPLYAWLLLWYLMNIWEE